jgi:hypothetical protein
MNPEMEYNHQEAPFSQLKPATSRTVIQERKFNNFRFLDERVVLSL